MATTQYIGPRIIPVFAPDVEWDITKTYDALMMVQHQGETFMSRQFVPAGISLPDTLQTEEYNDYWVHMSNWNAQVESYREEVLRYAAEVLEYNGRITEVENTLDGFDSTDTVKNAIDAINAAIEEVTNTVTNINAALPYEYKKVHYTGRSGATWVYYAKISHEYKPKLKLANDVIDTTELAYDAACRNHSTILANAGTFDVTTHETLGVVIADNQIKHEGSTAFTNQEILYMSKTGELNSVSGTMLADEVMEDYDPEFAVMGWYAIAKNGVFVATARDPLDAEPLTFIAQNYDGDYLIAVCGGRRIDDVGMSMADVYDFLQYINFNVKFAYNLDGGASSSLNVMGVRVNQFVNENRPVANYISFELDEKTTPELWQSAQSVNAANEAYFYMVPNQIYAQNYPFTINKDSHGGFLFKDVDRTTSHYIYRLLGLFGFYKDYFFIDGHNDSYDTQKPLFKVYNNGMITGLGGEHVPTNANQRLLDWGTYAINTAHQFTQPRNYVAKYLTVVESFGQRLILPSYTYNFGEPTTIGNTSTEWATALDYNGNPFRYQLVFNEGTVKLVVEALQGASITVGPIKTILGCQSF